MSGWDELCRNCGCPMRDHSFLTHRCKICDQDKCPHWEAAG